MSIRKVLPHLLAFVLLLGAALPGVADAKPVTVKAADGIKLAGEFNAVEGERAALLVHMLGRSKRDWAFTTDKLNAAGVATLAVDLRAHGENAGAETGPTDADFAAMRQDVVAGIEFLRAQGYTDITLIGASIGANLVLNAAAADPEITNVILLSPGMEYKGISIERAMAEYQGKLLIVASKEDTYSAKTAIVVDAQAKGPHHLEVYQAAGHGTKMLNKEPGLEPLLLSWVLGTYRTSDGIELGSIQVQTGDKGAVETEGKRLGEQ